MSAETRAALDAAIHAHYSDEWPGAYCTEYVIQCYGQHPESTQNLYLRLTPEGQPNHHTTGLIDHLAAGHANAVSEAMYEDDEE